MNPKPILTLSLFFPMRPALVLVACFLTLVGLPLEAQDSPTPAAPGVVAQDVSALDLYRQGGGFMHVLLICSIGTIAVAVYCFVQISRKKMAPGGLVNQVNAAMASRDVVAAYSACQAHPSSYARVMAGALLKVNFDRDLANKASMTEAAAESLDEEEHRQMVWVRLARWRGVTSEPAIEPPQVWNRLQPGGCGPGSSARRAHSRQDDSEAGH